MTGKVRHYRGKMGRGDETGKGKKLLQGKEKGRMGEPKEKRKVYISLVRRRQ